MPQYVTSNDLGESSVPPSTIYLDDVTISDTQLPQAKVSGPPSLGCLSLKSVGAVLAANPDLDAIVICQIVDSLIKMLCSCQDRWNDEKQALEARNRSLEDCILLHEETLVVLLEGYVVNGNQVQVGIPIREGLSAMAKWVKQLPDGHVACLTD